MKLRLGQHVRATDGPFGELADIVIDPLAKQVTHIVVEPHHQHLQARLVPIRLVIEHDEALDVALATEDLRQLQRVAFTDYVPLSEDIDLGDEWDVGTEDVIAAPYYDEDELETGWDTDRIGIAYDRVPKGECEIRRRSTVVTADGHRVGHVHGFVAEATQLSAVVVRTGVAGLGHDVLVPFAAVGRVRNDEIDLSIDGDRFHTLSKSPVVNDGSATADLSVGADANQAGRPGSTVMSVLAQGRRWLRKSTHRPSGSDHA